MTEKENYRISGDMLNRVFRSWIDRERKQMVKIAFDACPLKFYPIQGGQEFAAQFNPSSQPAKSVPLHGNKDGLPIGMPLIGRYADEATLFRLAGQFECVQPWFDRLPPSLTGKCDRSMIQKSYLER